MRRQLVAHAGNEGTHCRHAHMSMLEGGCFGMTAVRAHRRTASAVTKIPPPPHGFGVSDATGISCTSGSDLSPKAAQVVLVANISSADTPIPAADQAQDVEREVLNT